jgi:2-dehydro-3-deoxygluconokinase
MKHKIVTFGEVMMRLSTPGFATIEQSRQFNAILGGSEANVGIALAHFGVEATHATRFPDNLLGQNAIKYLRSCLLDTSEILMGGDRLGLFFLETGAAMRPSKIVYDRAGSSFAQLEKGMFDWEKILKDATWFHWSGISPAISQGATDCLLEGLKAAQKLGITVSADIFYRSNLWKFGKTPQEILPELASYSNIIIANEDNVKSIFGIENDGFIDAAQKISQHFPSVKKLIDTQRTSVSASHNLLKATMWNGSELIETENIDINPIIDRIGGGDAFIGGLIYGLMHFNDDLKSLRFGVAASALKHTIEGDASVSTIADVELIMAGEVAGKLRR